MFCGMCFIQSGRFSDSASDSYPHNVATKYLSPQPVLAVSIDILRFFMIFEWKAKFDFIHFVITLCYRFQYFNNIPEIFFCCKV